MSKKQKIEKIKKLVNGIDDTPKKWILNDGVCADKRYYTDLKDTDIVINYVSINWNKNKGNVNQLPNTITILKIRTPT